jgi:hypothetical protein
MCAEASGVTALSPPAPPPAESPVDTTFGFRVVRRPDVEDVELLADYAGHAILNRLQASG